MALRFRKSFKIAPGIRINVSKSGVSTSVGGKGLTANLSKRGTRITTGIPGTGISSSTLYKAKPRQQVADEPSLLASIITLAIIAFALWLIFR